MGPALATRPSHVPTIFYTKRSVALIPTRNASITVAAAPTELLRAPNHPAGSKCRRWVDSHGSTTEESDTSWSTESHRSRQTLLTSVWPRQLGQGCEPNSTRRSPTTAPVTVSVDMTVRQIEGEFETVVEVLRAASSVNADVEAYVEPAVGMSPR